MKRIVCSRCGELVFRRSISIESFHRYDLTNKEAYIESLMDIENVTYEVAESWASHGMFELCKEKIEHCCECGFQLKTWQATLCVNCGASVQSKAGS